MTKEQILNLTMKKCILDNWKAKLSYPLNYKDLEELERIIDYYEKHQNNLEKQLDQQDQIIREAREWVERKINSCTIEANSTTTDTMCRITIVGLKNLLKILDRNVK